MASAKTIAAGPQVDASLRLLVDAIDLSHASQDEVVLFEEGPDQTSLFGEDQALTGEVTDLATALIQHRKDCDVQVFRKGLVAKGRSRPMSPEDSSAEVAVSRGDTVANFDHLSSIAEKRR